MRSEKMLMPASLVVGALLLASVLLFFIQPTPPPQSSGPGQAGGSTARTSVSREPNSEAAGFALDGPSQDQPSMVAEVQIEESASSEEQLVAGTPSWELPVNAILESADDNDTVAMKLDALARSLPVGGQVEATQHMVNLLGDENYRLARGKLTNPATPREVMDVVYSDVLNRPNTVKLPTLVDVAAVPGHPLRAEATETLRIFVGRDLGNDAQAWSLAVQEFLREEAGQELEAAAQSATP